jgi:CDP-glycerol glycerophosphotransferase
MIRARVRGALRRLRRGQGAGGNGLRGFYEERLREPIDPQLAVFAAYWNRGYSCNPRAIYERARELVPEMRGVWVVKRDAADSLPPDVERVFPGTREYYDVMARARYLVNNVNFPNNIVKREGSVHVMTHHGTPLKRMGLDLRGRPDAEERVDFDALMRRCARWDYSISQNAFTTPIWERAFPLDYETLEVGYPRNDVLSVATPDRIERVRAELGIEPGRRAVLFAPTHREYEPEYVPTLDLAAVSEGLGDDHVLLVRLHYFYADQPALRDLRDQGRILDVASYPVVEDLYLAADALITDYSSMMFDYGVLDRPIVIHAPDWETYVERRGVTFDLMAEPPGVVTRTDAELIEAFRSGAVFGDDARSLRAAFRARFCSLDDGHAAERVVRRVWLGERDAAPQHGAVAR